MSVIYSDSLHPCRTPVSFTVQAAARVESEHLVFTGEDAPVATLMLSVMGAVAEFERTLIRERQREGIALAKQRGVYRGRHRSLHPEQIEELRNRVEAGEAKARIAGEFGISRQSLYRLLRAYEPRH